MTGKGLPELKNYIPGPLNSSVHLGFTNPTGHYYEVDLTRSSGGGGSKLKTLRCQVCHFYFGEMRL